MGDEVSTVVPVEGSAAPAAPAQDAEDLQTRATESLISEVSALSDSVRLLAAQDEGSSTSAVVLVDDGQYAWIQGAVRFMSSELFAILVFAALAVGVALWRVLSGGWR